jgi:3-phenylpropionate/cinnamic acid dioxygenase small subunit
MNDTERMLAEHAIARMIIRYAALNDASDWDAVAAMYIETGRMSRPVAPDDFVEGREAILAAFKARPPRTTRHICANIMVDMESETSARATSQIMLFTAKDAIPMVGSYHDKLVLTDARWRFAERRGSLDFTS